MIDVYQTITLEDYADTNYKTCTLGYNGTSYFISLQWICNDVVYFSVVLFAIFGVMNF